MARRTKSLKYGTVLHDGEGYGHRDHRSKKGRKRGYQKSRGIRLTLKNRLEKLKRRDERRDGPLGLFDSIL